MSHIERECRLLGHEWACDHENDPPVCLHCGTEGVAKLADYRRETWSAKDIEEVGRLMQAAQYELEAFGDQSGVAEGVIKTLAKARAILNYAGEVEG